MDYAHTRLLWLPKNNQSIIPKQTNTQWEKQYFSESCCLFDESCWFFRRPREWLSTWAHCQNFRDTPRNVEENEILHEIFRKVSRFPHYISCYISENRLPLGQCTACCTVYCTRSHFDTRLSCAWIFVGKNGKSHTYKSENRYVLVVSFLIFLAILNRSKTVRKHFSNWSVLVNNKKIWEQL